jgi:hypothetical protein
VLRLYDLIIILLLHTLLQKIFLEIGKMAFVGAGASLLLAAKNSCLQRQVCYPPLEIDLQGRVWGDPPLKINFQVRVRG